MIAFVKGEIASVGEEGVVIDTGNMGYHVKVTAETINRIAGVGSSIKLYTYTYIREDIFQLYGFLHPDDLAIFKRLITVNGIGPKGGLAILSTMSADDLRFAILAGDIKAISKAPGIGKKTAERLILDLRDKISLPDMNEKSGYDNYAGADLSGGISAAQNEAVEALAALGYSVTEASKAVRLVEGVDMTDTEAILKAALKKLF